MGNALVDLAAVFVGIFGVIGVLGLLRSGLYGRIGSAGYPHGEHPDPRPGSAGHAAQRELEIRQMLQARSERRERMGQPPLDLDAEVAQLLDLTPRAPTDQPEIGSGQPAESLWEFGGAHPHEIRPDWPAESLWELGGAHRHEIGSGQPAESRQAGRAHRHDPELVEELRQLAEARNARRVRRGEQPLDVGAEVARALSELES